MQIKDNFYYKIIMLIVLPVLMVIGFYFSTIYKYEYQSVVSMKIYTEPKLLLQQYKRQDLELTEDEYLSLRISYPDKVYESKPKYEFIIDTKRITVTQAEFNTYKEGDSITYYNEFIFDFPKLHK